MRPETRVLSEYQAYWVKDKDTPNGTCHMVSQVPFRFIRLDTVIEAENLQASG